MSDTLKKEVGHIHECPIGFSPETVIGGYVFCTSIDGLFVYGKHGYNLSTAPIQSLIIIPLTKERIDEIASDEGQVGDVFYLEDNTVYYSVSLGDYSYMFKDLTTALSFIGTVVEYKSHALTDAFLKKRIEDET